MNDEELWAQEAHDERKRIREERDHYREKYLELQASQWFLCSGRLPEPLKPVMVDGGPAYYDGRGWWVSMVESPHRVIQWDVKRWAELPATPVDR